MYIQGVSAFRLRMPEQRVKVVDFDICQNAQKLIGYHSNIPWASEKLMTTYAERLAKIGLVIAEIFSQIGRFLPSCPKRCSCYPRDLRGYWTNCHQNCTQCREIHLFTI